MRYFLDCEFDGHLGSLLSMALFREDGVGFYIVTTNQASDPWVLENVIPIMDEYPTSSKAPIPENDLYKWIHWLLYQDESNDIVVIADSPVDFTYFTKAISTDSKGEWRSVDYPKLTLVVENVECWPCDIPYAVRHNAAYDALALRMFILDRDDESI